MQKIIFLARNSALAYLDRAWAFLRPSAYNPQHHGAALTSALNAGIVFDLTLSMSMSSSLFIGRA